MATTFYPNAGKPGSTSVDGTIGYRQDQIVDDDTYATAHNAATGTSVDADGTGVLVPENDKFAGIFFISRCPVNFDTSALTANATIVSATLSFWPTAKTDNDNDALSLVVHTCAAANDYAVADYDQFGTTKQADDIDYGAITTGQYNDFTLNAAGLASISKTGVTKFGLRTANDIAATEPTGLNYVVIKSADAADTTNDPKLTVTYTLPGIFGTRIMAFQAVKRSNSF